MQADMVTAVRENAVDFTTRNVDKNEGTGRLSRETNRIYGGTSTGMRKCDTVC
jgi:hypothetical protein